MGAHLSSIETTGCHGGLDEVVTRLIVMRELEINGANNVALDTLIHATRNAQVSLSEAHLQQLELLEAFEVLLILLHSAAEQSLCTAGVMHLLAPLVKKLSQSIDASSAAIH